MTRLILANALFIAGTLLLLWGIKRWIERYYKSKSPQDNKTTNQE